MPVYPLSCARLQQETPRRIKKLSPPICNKSILIDGSKSEAITRRSDDIFRKYRLLGNPSKKHGERHQINTKHFCKKLHSEDEVTLRSSWIQNSKTRTMAKRSILHNLHKNWMYLIVGCTVYVLRYSKLSNAHAHAHVCTVYTVQLLHYINKIINIIIYV